MITTFTDIRAALIGLGEITTEKSVKRALLDLGVTPLRNAKDFDFVEKFYFHTEPMSHYSQTIIVDIFRGEDSQIAPTDYRYKITIY